MISIKLCTIIYDFFDFCAEQARETKSYASRKRSRWKSYASRKRSRWSPRRNQCSRLCTFAACTAALKITERMSVIFCAEAEKWRRENRHHATYAARNIADSRRATGDWIGIILLRNPSASRADFCWKLESRALPCNERAYPRGTETRTRVVLLSIDVDAPSSVDLNTNVKLIRKDPKSSLVAFINVASK